jgi:hypothetical protein
MKRIIVLMVVVAFGVVLFSSCKTANCPAYSKVDNNAKVEQRI